MATIDATIDQIITGARTTADKYLGLSETATNSARTAAQGFAWAVDARQPFEVEAVEPDVPTAANTMITYSAQLDEVMKILTDGLADFFITYYPLTNDAFDEATAWLTNTIVNGGTGIPPAVEAQIWERARGRLLVEGGRQEQKILNDFSERGFSIPSGALRGSLREIRADQHAKISGLSADVAIEQAKIEIETIKFAVDQAMKARLMAINAASDYIRALMSAPDIASRIATIETDAQARMISATATLYNSRLHRDELLLNASNADQQTVLESGKLYVDGFYRSIGNQVSAANAAAQSYGQAASASLQSISTIASAGQSLF